MPRRQKETPKYDENDWPVSIRFLFRDSLVFAWRPRLHALANDWISLTRTSESISLDLTRIRDDMDVADVTPITRRHWLALAGVGVAHRLILNAALTNGGLDVKGSRSYVTGWWIQIRAHGACMTYADWRKTFKLLAGGVYSNPLITTKYPQNNCSIQDNIGFTFLRHFGYIHKRIRFMIMFSLLFLSPQRNEQFIVIIVIFLINNKLV